MQAGKLCGHVPVFLSNLIAKLNSPISDHNARLLFKSQIKSEFICKLFLNYSSTLIIHVNLPITLILEKNGS